MVLLTVVPTSFMGVDSFDKTRFRFIVGYLRLSLWGTDTGGEEEWRLAIWFDCSALNWDHGLVDCGTNIIRGCWLFGQNKIQVYCGASRRLSLWGTDTGGEEWRLAIWFVCSAFNWDRGLVNCGTNILRGCWLFRQNEIQVYRGASLTIVCREQLKGGRVTSCHLFWLLSVKLGIVVLSTVVPTSFVADDSLDKTRFRFTAGHLWLWFAGNRQRGKSDVLPFDLIAQR